MIIGVVRETFDSERRVALVPQAAAALIKLGYEVRVQAGAGTSAGFPDEQYQQRGAIVVPDRAAVIAESDLLLQVRTLGTNPDAGRGDLDSMHAGQAIVGLADPLMAHDAVGALADKGVSLIAVELLPRITRAQSMDVLSSQANLAGFKAVIRAADLLPQIFPMMMTAAGTIHAAKVFIVGAGVAGLQAIATAKRLGAVVSAFDVRPEVKEQVESLAAKFVQLPMDTSAAQGTGGYAKEQSEEQLRKQQELMTRTVAESDVVVTTALIPGRKAPTLITAAMVEQMKPGSVVIDLAAEKGGNCELTQPGKTVDHNGVTIVGDENLIASVALDASLLYANNLVNLIKHLTNKERQFVLDTADEITAGILVTRDGQIVHPRVRQAMNLGPQETTSAPEPAAHTAPEAAS